LRFSPTAWAKLLYLRDRGPTEVGGFGIASTDDLLFVEDIQLVRQTCTTVSVAFDDASVAEFFDDQVDAGRKPEQFARVWIHTHPGESATPSHVDEGTFERVFGSCDWAVMFVLARRGETYCRLRYRSGPGGQFEIRTDVDFDRQFAGTDFEAWAREYKTTVEPAPQLAPFREGRLIGGTQAGASHELFDDLWWSFDSKNEEAFYDRPL
jgi:proteasome lid subunit RPN8/RPN11